MSKVPSDVTSKSLVSKSLVWTVSNALLQIATKVGSLVALSYLLPPSDFGAYNIGLAVAIILATLAQYGVATNLIYLDHITRRSVAAASFVAISGAIFLSSVTGLIYYFYFFNSTPIGYSILALLAYPLVQAPILVYEAVSKRSFDFKIVVVSELVASSIGNLIISLALALMGFGFWSLIIGQFIYGFVRLGILLTGTRPYLGWRFDREDLRCITKASWAISLAEFANIATVYSQRPLIGSALGASAAGIWSRFYQVILIQLTAFVQPIDNLVLPILARRKHDTGFNGLIGSMIEFITLVTVPVSAATIFVAPWIVPMLFGPSWTDLVIPLQIGAITLFFRGVDRVMLSSARAAGLMRVRALTQWLQLVFVTFSIVFALEGGLVAVAWAYVIGQAAALAANIIIFGSAMGISRVDFIRSTAPTWILTSTWAAATVLVCRTLEISLDSPRSFLALSSTAVVIAATALMMRKLIFSSDSNLLFSAAVESLIARIRR